MARVNHLNSKWDINCVTSKSVKEWVKLTLMVVGILALIGGSLAGCYGMALGIHQLICKVGVKPAIVLLTLGSIGLVWGICYLPKLFPTNSA